MCASGKIRHRILAALLLCFGVTSLARGGQIDEYKLKAAYLYRFGEFVTWPSTAPTGGVVIGILDFPPYKEAVRQEFKDASMGDSCRFIDIDTPEQARACHIVFINTVDRGALDRFISVLSGAPVLVVTDVRNGARIGAAINFFTIDGKIRFAINEKAAKQNGLDISSRLLRLGRVIEDEQDQGETHESD